MIISVINQKGGVGKTTSALNLGAYLAGYGKKVLLIDIDPQSNLSAGIGIKNPKTSIYDILTKRLDIKSALKDTAIDNLKIVPSNINLAGAEVELVGLMARERILKEALDTVGNDYDFIIIDCPPSLGLLTLNALTSSDKLIIPVQCEYFALEGLGQLLDTIKLVKQSLNPTLTILGVLLTMYDPRTNLSKEVAQEVKNKFKTKVFDTIIPRNIKLSEAPSHRKPINLYKPKSSGAIAYKNVARLIIEST